MKKLLCISAIIVFLVTLTACGGKGNTPTVAADVDVYALKQGDEVSIVGQTAASTLENGNTLIVQVLRNGDRTVVYHCRMKDEFIAEAEGYKPLDVAKVTGKFLSLTDMAGEPGVELPKENIAILVTLYDCELK